MLGRHVTRRILSPALVILTVVAVTLTVMQLVRLGPLFLGPWVRPADAALVLALVPFLALGLPAAIALSTCLAAGSLSRRGERAALAAAGVPPLRILRAPVLLAVLAAALTAVLTLWAVPRSFALLAHTATSLAARAAFATLPDGRFTDLPGGGVLFSRGSASTGGVTTLSGVLVDLSPEGGPRTTISARSARVEHHGAGRTTFHLEHAFLRSTGWPGGTLVAEVSELSVPVDMGRLITARSETLPAVLATPTSSLDPAASPLHLYHLNRRAAVPTVSLLVMLAAALSLVPPTLRRPWLAPALAALAIVTFHALMRGAEELLHRGLLDPVTAAWLPLAALLPPAPWLLSAILRRPPPSHRPAGADR